MMAEAIARITGFNRSQILILILGVLQAIISRNVLNRESRSENLAMQLKGM